VLEISFENQGFAAEIGVSSQKLASYFSSQNSSL
jgi:hypothetical protein